MESSGDWKPKFRIVVVGCGIGGLTAAIGAKRAGFDVTVLEQAPELREVGAGIQVPANATTILKQWGLLENANRHSMRPQKVRWRSYKNGHVVGHLSLSPYTEKVYGLPHFSIHRRDYQAILHEEAVRLCIKIRLGTSVSGFNLHKGLVHLSTGDVLEADLVFGGDGGRSICRDHLVGRKTIPNRSGEAALRLMTSTEAIRQNPETAGLLDDPSLDIWMGPKIHVICYQLVKEDSFNLVLCVPDASDESEELNLALKEIDIETARNALEGWDPRLRAILDMATHAAQSTLGQIKDLDTWVDSSNKLVLLGDSAHPMLPYLAQGAAIAVEDAATIAMLLDECSSPDQIPDLLQVYDKMRRPRATKIKDMSYEMRFILGYSDGTLQQDRDRRIAMGFSEIHPIPYANAVYRDWMWGYDAIAEAKKAWKEFLTSSGDSENGRDVVKAKL